MTESTSEGPRDPQSAQERPWRPVNPPTIRQGGGNGANGSGQAAAAGEQRPANPPTIRQGAGPDASGSAGAASGEDTGRAAYFPEALLAEYQPAEVRGRGQEAVVWRVWRRADGREAALKVHWVGNGLDLDLLRHLNQDRFRQHVPELLDFGVLETPYGQAGWVAMELLPITLDTLIASEGARPGGMQPERIRQLVAEIAETLRFWQDPAGIARTPIDLKPDNLGIRSSPAGQIVVLDFGGVVRDTVTQRVGDVLAAMGYMAPEGVVGERHPMSPWWSLGVIAHEMLTGHTRFRRADGSLLAPDAVRRDLTLGEFDLSEVRDERWQLLLGGLLTREPADRWGSDEVSAWLHGDSPPVIRPAGYSTAGRTVGWANEPINFNGIDFRSPEDLAAHMLDNWSQAAGWLSQNAARLRTWLREEVGDREFDTGYLRAIEAGSTRYVALVLLAFGAAYIGRQVTPKFKDRVISAEGLTHICQSGADGTPFLRELVDDGVIAIAAGYQCAHPSCQAGKRCRVLDRIAAAVPAIMSAAPATVAAVGPAAGGRSPAAPRGTAGWAAMTQAEADSVLPAAFLLALDPAAGRGRVLRMLARPRRLSHVWAVPWWWRHHLAVLRANPHTSAGQATLATAVVVQQRAVAAQAAANARVGGRPLALPAVTGSRVGGALLAVLALPLLYWSAAVTSAMLADHDSRLMSHQAYVAAMGRALGAQAAAVTFAVLPLFLLIALLAFVLRAGPYLLVGGAAGVIALGFAGHRVPAFPVPAPHALYSPLHSFGGLWRQWTGVAGAVIIPVIALVIVLVARRMLSTPGYRYRAGAAAGPLARVASGWRRALSGLVTFVTAEVLLWAAVAVRETVTGPRLPGVVVAADAAVMQSGLLASCAALGLLAALLPRVGARRVLWAAAGAAIAVGGWPRLLQHAQGLWHQAGTARFLGIAATWGGAAFWAAVLIYLPIALLAMRIGVRANGGRL